MSNRDFEITMIEIKKDGVIVGFTPLQIIEDKPICFTDKKGDLIIIKDESLFEEWIFKNHKKIK